MTERIRKCVCALLAFGLLTLAACAGEIPAPADSKPQTSQQGPVSESAESEGETATESTAEGSVEAEPGRETLTVGSIAEFDRAFMEYTEAKIEGNYMISPVSFHFALGMLIEGAEGTTKEGLLKALGCTETELRAYVQAVNAFASAFASALEEDKASYARYGKSGKGGDEEPSGALQVTNSVWRRDTLEDFRSRYKERLEQYGAEYFAFTPDTVVRQVNRWADEKTNGMIPKILDENYDVSELAVILMNALYYRNSWQNSFRKVGSRTFTARAGNEEKKIDRPYISSRSTYRYYKDDETEICVIPMKYGVEMVFVKGSRDGLEEKIGQARNEDVIAYVPELDFETDVPGLCEFLTGCGGGEALSGNADFSGMFEQESVFVSDIVQKTKIKLDETGVEAAAVTAIMMNTTAVERPSDPIVFDLDRPFSFYICGEQDGRTIRFFEGRVNS